MGVKIGILLIAILAGCFADPLPNSGFVDNDLFYHVDTATRIIGGTPAAAGSVPYMVAMTQGIIVSSFVCGGSILTQKTVLTAAHCIEAVFIRGELSSSLRVTVGTNRWDTGGQTLPLSHNITHQNYDNRIIKNDIGILVTLRNIIFSELVVPVTPSYDFVDEGVAARAAGWGRIRVGGPGSPILLELIVTTIEGERCVRDVANALSAIHVDPHVELCVTHSVNHGMCHGDSGSALVGVDNGQQIGIVSWGVPCARGAPDMFVRVSAFKDWILEHLV